MRPMLAATVAGVFLAMQIAVLQAVTSLEHRLTRLEVLVERSK